MSCDTVPFNNAKNPNWVIKANVVMSRVKGIIYIHYSQSYIKIINVNQIPVDNSCGIPCYTKAHTSKTEPQVSQAYRLPTLPQSLPSIFPITHTFFLHLTQTHNTWRSMQTLPEATTATRTWGKPPPAYCQCFLRAGTAFPNSLLPSVTTSQSTMLTEDIVLPKVSQATRMPEVAHWWTRKYNGQLKYRPLRSED